MTVWLVSAFTFGLLIWLLGGSLQHGTRQALILPGPLSAAHGAVQTCDACHAAAQAAAPHWSASAFSSATRMADSRRCLACHRDIGDQGLSPHGLPPGDLARVTERLRQTPGPDAEPLTVFLAGLGPGAPLGPDREVACATCHGEHRGSAIRLTQMSSLRCQVCHLRKFTGLAEGHPEFADYPSPRYGAWQFNHVSHEVQHFPTEKAAFDCRSCHAAAPDGRAQQVAGFDRACTGCHHHVPQIQGFGKGIAVFRIPGVDYDTLLDNDIEIGEWPVDANLDLEEDPTPFMKLLLASDPQVARAIRTLEQADVHLYDLEGAAAPQLEAAERIVWGVKELYYDLLTKTGREKLAGRLQRGIGGALSNPELAALIGQSSVDAVRTAQLEWLLLIAQQQWLPRLTEEVPQHRAGKTVRFEENDRHNRYGEESRMPGWYLDPSNFAIRYRPTGHADGFLRGWIDVSGRLYGASDAAHEICDLLTSSAPDTPGQCMKCHRLTASPDRQHRLVDWTGAQTALEARSVTTFAHAPHLLVKDCRACHVLAAEQDFQPITKAACTECHTGDRAGDRCLACHTYHVASSVL
jgi:hypothetical protein